MKAKIKITSCLVVLVCLLGPAGFLRAQTIEDFKKMDSDGDNLSDFEEMKIYHTDPTDPDTDRDGYIDGDEVKYLYDPNLSHDDKLEKVITVDTATQNLAYTLGPYVVDSFPVSTGKKGWDTPHGEFKIFVKKPVVKYEGSGYSYPNTRWNMQFTRVKAGGIYIHGAYWHNNFGQAYSHGCVNVAYKNVEALYNWADLGTKVIVK